jgi:hypothetical protein
MQFAEKTIKINSEEINYEVCTAVARFFQIF